MLAYPVQYPEVFHRFCGELEFIARERRV